MFAALSLPETALIVGLAGLLVGSFLNVVIHRLPRMMQDQWVREAAEWQALQGDSWAPQPSAAPRPAPD